MTVTFTTGSIFEAAETHALVIPVNTQGVAGAGLAKTAARKSPAWLTSYKAWCKSAGRGKSRQPGSIRGFMAESKTGEPWYWVCAATKGDWKEPSKVEWVCQCLWRLSQLTSPLAVPKIGCGLGGLDWGVVRRHVEAQGAQAKSDWLVYE